MDDGKSWYSAWTFHIIKKIYYKGRGLGRGGCQIDPGQRLVDSQVGSCWHFFGPFFRVLFLTSFLEVFSSILERFWRPKWVPNSSFGHIFGMLFWHPHFGVNFRCIFVLFSMLNFLKIVIFPGKNAYFQGFAFLALA